MTYMYLKYIFQVLRDKQNKSLMDKLLFLVTKQFLVTYAKHKTARIYEKKNTLRLGF